MFIGKESALRENEMSVATPHHSQKISDPDGVKIHITLKNARVFIADKEGNKVEFSAHQVPEVRATLLDVEKKFWGGLSSGR